MSNESGRDRAIVAAIERQQMILGYDPDEAL
jgi:hypothetical protein